MAEIDGYSDVTELPGQRVSRQQIFRQIQRYVWAAELCRDLDTLDCACGSAPGMGILARSARSVKGADIDADIIDVARRHYRDRYELVASDAARLPFPDRSFGAMLLFEAIYYIRDVDDFFNEAKRVLAPGGKLLIATANKDLFDFTPSAFSCAYYNPPELLKLTARHGFETCFYGGDSIVSSGVLRRIARPVKAFASKYGLVPVSMRAKEPLRALLFGPLIEMKPELTGDEAPFVAPIPIPADSPDRTHQVLYCVATKQE